MIIIIFLSWIIFAVIMYKRSNKDFRFSEVLLPLILIYTVFAIGLGVNAVQPGTTEGISINNVLAYWIIGGDDWSRTAFLEYFNEFLYSALLLIFIYSLLKLFKK
ncbi:hypothetical protein [Vallitalea okinawensis]|uniref:hypothetical protein n=1 Tax=Vallitalea okinawensis TaxID=2078660 RepID=UPI000CFABEC9|nr:hypothetical protein [Vallitalea okinawensis]